MSQARESNTSSRGPRSDRGVVVAQIVDAARESFANNGWAGTTMRAVAREAGVDPALVHYYFKSKEELLAAATTPPEAFFESVRAAMAVPVERRGEAILQNAIEQWSDERTGTTLRSIFLTAAHEPRTLERLRAVLTTSLIGAMADELDDDARLLRAVLISSQMVGFIMVRFVWRIEPLASLPDDEAVRIVGPTIQRYLNGELAPS
jgi:AcrR family transcriptional regulator